MGFSWMMLPENDRFTVASSYLREYFMNTKLIFKFLRKRNSLNSGYDELWLFQSYHYLVEIAIDKLLTFI
ncbi:hypothetical protein BLOT_003522 [Blomia tropicalis]|nr:hypothetical protein BLOT_003522 [Blomia tropicalis]